MRCTHTQEAHGWIIDMFCNVANIAVTKRELKPLAFPRYNR